MLEQFGTVLEFEYKKIFETVETKKLKIRSHFEANKVSLKRASDRIIEILEEAKTTFDFSLALRDYEIRNHTVYLSNSAGVLEWSYPEKKEDLTWDNYLIGITKYSSHEFNFLFKNG